jgi:hypothetical protein
VNPRPLVAGALAAVAVATTGLLGACSSGQIAQTAEIQPGVGGVSLSAPDGRRVYIRDLTVAYHGPKGYAKGSNAPLDLWIFNSTEGPVTLSRVGAALQAQPDATRQPVSVVISAGGNTAAPCSVPKSLAPSPSAPSPSPSSASPSSPAAKSSAKGSASASASASTSPSPSPTPSPTVGSSEIHVVVPAGGCVELSTRAAQYLQLAGLPDALSNAQTVLAGFEFTDSAGKTFDIGTPNDPARIPLAVPDSPRPRTS